MTVVLYNDKALHRFVQTKIAEEEHCNPLPDSAIAQMIDDEHNIKISPKMVYLVRERLDLPSKGARRWLYRHGYDVFQEP